MSGVGGAIARSAAWTIAMRLADRSIGFLSMLVLARLLAPEDFGVVAMATAVVALLDALSAFGFEWYIIQQRTRERRILDTTWTMNLVIGITNALILLISIPIVVRLFDEPRLVPVMMLLSLVLVVGGLRNVGMILFEQDLQFRNVFLLGLTKKLAGFAVTLSVALMYGSYWALVLGQLTIALTDMLLSYIMSPYRPRPTLVAWREIFRFSRWLYASNVLWFANSRGMHFVIGNQDGAATLGKYTLAYELANLPTSEIIQPTFRAMFPGFAKLHEQTGQLGRIVPTAVGLCGLLAIPAALGLIVLAELIVAVLLGPKWTGVVPLMQLLALLGSMNSIVSPLIAANLAAGHPKIPALLALAQAFFGLPTFTLVYIQFDLPTALLALLGVTVANILLLVVSSHRSIGIKVGAIAQQLWRPVAAGVVMGVALLELLPVVHQPSAPWTAQFLTLLMLILAGALIYFATLFALWRMSGSASGAESQAVEAIRALHGRLRPGTT